MKAAPVLAPYHVLVIEEIFFGCDKAPNAQYVMLRTLAGFQVFVNNQEINVQNGDGTAAPNFGTFTALTNPRLDSGVAILMGTPEAEDLFGITMDHVTSGRLISPDGRICFGSINNSPVDCVAYGAYTGSDPGADSPAPAPVPNMALVRVSNTNNDTDDFRVAAPCPQNNAGTRVATCPTPTPTLVPSGTPSTTATATLRPPPPVTDYVCPGDCNRDRTVMVNEVVRHQSSPVATSTRAQADTNRDGSVRQRAGGSVNSVLAAAHHGHAPLQSQSTNQQLHCGVESARSSLASPGHRSRAGIPNTDGLAFSSPTPPTTRWSSRGRGADTVLCIRPHKGFYRSSLR
jgi:hypothetical protein